MTDLANLDLRADQALEVHDLLCVELASPVPARLFPAHRQMPTERNFDDVA